MTERQLKRTLGVTLVSSHVLVVTVMLAMFALGFFSFDELTDLVGMVIPMFAGYTTAVVSYIISARAQLSDTSANMTPEYVGMSFAFPMLFTILVIAAILAQGLGAMFADFPQFKKMLLLLESVFAIYAGRFIFSMFDKEESAGSGGPPKLAS